MVEVIVAELRQGLAGDEVGDVHDRQDLCNAAARGHSRSLVTGAR